MIDFRYHLVSIVAVLLALSVGVILGTGALGGPLLEDIDRNVEDLRETNARLQEEVNDARNRLDAERSFSVEAEPFVLQDVLNGTEVVVIEVAGTDGGLADGLRNSIGAAGGTVASTIELLDRFRLGAHPDVDSLALAIGSVSSDPEVLLQESSEELARRLADAAGGRDTGATGLVEDLQEADFLDVESESDGPFIPPGASFIIVGGGPDEGPFDAASFVLVLARALGERDVPVAVTEPSGSSWGLVSGVRNDGAARDVVATADGVSEVYGRVAAIMALERAGAGEILHLGRLPGAEDLLPQPQGQ